MWNDGILKRKAQSGARAFEVLDDPEVSMFKSHPFSSDPSDHGFRSIVLDADNA